LADKEEGWLALRSGEAAPQQWYRGGYPDKHNPLEGVRFVLAEDSSDLGQSILDQIKDITESERKYTNEQIRSLFDAMLQRSETDHDAMSKRVDHGLAQFDEKCEILERCFKQHLDVERQHLSDLYSDHATSTKTILQDVETRFQSAQATHVEDIKKQHEDAALEMRSRMLTCEQHMSETTEKMQSTQEAALNDMRWKLQSMIGYIEENMWYYILEVLRSLLKKGFINIEDGYDVKKMLTSFVQGVAKPLMIKDAPRKTRYEPRYGDKRDSGKDRRGNSRDQGGKSRDHGGKSRDHKSRDYGGKSRDRKSRDRSGKSRDRGGKGKHHDDKPFKDRGSDKRSSKSRDRGKVR